MKKITVLIADDHTVVREGLRLLLEKAEDIEVVGEAADGFESVRQAKKLQPDVVLQDLGMPLLNGLEAARQIAREVPSAKVLILSAYTDDQHIEQAIEAGVAGYLLKETLWNELVHAIREIARGTLFFSPSVARRLSNNWQSKLRKGCPVSTKGTALTGRQMEVLQLIAEGYATKQIADLLLLSIKTVEKHRQKLMDTLNIHNIATLTRYAVSTGVVETNLVPTWTATSAPRGADWKKSTFNRDHDSVHSMFRSAEVRPSPPRAETDCLRCWQNQNVHFLHRAHFPYPTHYQPFAMNALVNPVPPRPL